MTIFREKRCCAFTWNGSGDYFGVLAERRGDRVDVQRIWNASDSKRSPAEMLREGFAQLGNRGDALVLVGGSTEAGYFKELTMPRMPAADLVRAVQFELPKHCPLPTDDVRWGIRVVGDLEDNQRLVRLVIIPESDWTAWVEAASGIGHGVDTIVPPAAVLDPLLGDRAVCLGYDHELGSFVLSPEGGGRRRAAYTRSVHSQTETFGMGPHPLATDALRPGPLAELPPEAAGRFAPAVLVAMYGLSRQYHADKGRWLEVPRELRPRRNRLLKVTAALMAIFLVAAVGYLATRHFLDSSRRQASLRAQERVLREHLAAYRTSADLDARIDQLEVALMNNLLGYQSLPEALLELTTSLDHQVYAARLAWSDGEVALTLTATVDRPDQLVALNQSELFTNFRQLKKELRKDGSVLYQVEMKQKNAHQLSAMQGSMEPEAEPPAEAPADEAATEPPEADPALPAEAPAAEPEAPAAVPAVEAEVSAADPPVEPAVPAGASAVEPAPPAEAPAAPLPDGGE